MKEIIYSKKNLFEKKDIFFKNFKAKLKKDGIPNDSIEKLSEKIKNIVKHVDNKNKSILLVGNIQSGKTNSFLGIISKVFDNEKINLAIVFGGVDNDIYEQNQDRIKKLFSDIYISSEIKILFSKDYKEKMIHEDILNNLKNGRKILIICIKNYHVINSWNNELKKLNKFISGVVIIDDEGDQFSLNNNKKKDEKTATNNAIYNLQKTFENKRTFFSVTATPYAFQMIDKFDFLKPDYAFLIDRGVGYTGLSYFLAEENEYRNNIAKIISDQEIEDFNSQKF